MCSSDLVVTRALVGNQPSERLADVVGVSAVLGAWIARRGLAVSARWWGNRGHLWAGVALVVLWSVTAVAIGIHARLGASIADAHLLNGPAAVWTNLVETYERLRSRPLEYRAPNGSRDQLDVLAGYARRCTSTNDRLLVVAGFAPQLFFFAERGFAGGQVHFLRRWHDSAQDQLLTLVRLRRQNVPVAFVGADQIGFNQGFSLIAEYVEQQYEETPFAYVGGGPWHVRIKRGMQPVSMDRDTGLPCFAPLA